MAVETAVSGRAKMGRVRRVVVGLVILLGMLVIGAATAFVVAVFGAKIDRFVLPFDQYRYSGQGVNSSKGANVMAGLVSQTATLQRMAINVDPPELSEQDIISIFDPEWKDGYVDPLLNFRKTFPGSNDSVGWEWAPGDSVHYRTIHVIRSGWPMAALWGVLSGIDTNVIPPMPTARWERRGIAEGSAEIPLIVIPLGLAVNTVFFALATAVVVFGPLWGFRFVRREVRRAKVQCVACGYKLKSRVALCPECGNKAPRTW